MARSLNPDPLGGGYFAPSGGGPGSGGTLYGTSGGGGGTVDPISQQFSNIQKIIGTPTGPSLPPIVAQGPTSGFAAGINSSDILRQGINLVGGQGVNLANLGNTILGTGMGTLQPSVDFYSRLLSGDPATVTSALAPTASAVNQFYQPLISNAQMNMPRGGFSASTAAELPFTVAGKVGDAALGLQSTAADKLAQLGLDVSKIGELEQTLGQTGIEAIISAALGKMGNTSSTTQNLANIGTFISGLI